MKKILMEYFSLNIELKKINNCTWLANETYEVKCFRIKEIKDRQEEIEKSEILKDVLENLLKQLK